VGADLGTKHWAERALAAGSESITAALRFQLSKNPGGVASFLRDAPDAVRIPFFFAATALAIIAMIHFWRKLGGSETSMRLLGGALGNLVDRVRYGYVIDFIDVHAAWRGSDVHWPTFNVADVAICAGAVLLALARLHQSRGRVGGRA
jgi:signal peptidase II